MRLLLDTHICDWFATRIGRLKPAERRAMDDSDAVAFSAVSIWETRLKWNSRYASGDRKGPIDPAELLDALSVRGLTAIPVTPAMAAVGLVHPLVHNDPFDELLLIQAQEGGYRLLTRDGTLKSHPLALAA